MSGRTQANALHAAKRRKFVFDLRASGLNYQDIVSAVKLNFPDCPASYDERYAWRDVMYTLDKLKGELSESAENTRAIMLDQIDRVMLAVFQKSQAGDLKAVDRFIRLQDQKARLVGAYAPTQVKISDWRSEIIALMQQRRLEPAQVRDYLGDQLYRELVEQRSAYLLENGEVEDGDFRELEEAVS